MTLGQYSWSSLSAEDIFDSNQEFRGAIAIAWACLGPHWMTTVGHAGGGIFDSYQEFRGAIAIAWACG